MAGRLGSERATAFTRNAWPLSSECAGRIETFPEGGVVVAKIDGHIEGYISAQLVDGVQALLASWQQTTDGGTIRRTHNPTGVWLHGIGLAVTPEGSKHGVTSRLVRHVGRYVVLHRKRGAMFVTRMPGFHRFASRMSPEEYVTSQQNGSPRDPELRLWKHYGFEVVQPPVILKDYVEGGGDPRSRGAGVLVRRLNPFWERPSPWFWSRLLRA